MILHDEPGYLRAAPRPRAAHGVPLAGVQVGLELAQGALPLAPVILKMEKKKNVREIVVREK